MPGTLYVVATPIGNLEDITLRALRILRDVDLIAAEDTRRTARLLTHYAIVTPTTSFHEHNARSRTPQLLARLAGGQSIALVTDAGTPGVSDPGAELVRSCVEAGVRVESLPGPSAALVALTASGFPLDPVLMRGFPPSRSSDRRQWLSEVADFMGTVVFFEAPHRIRETLTLGATFFGERQIVVARELTKVHEQLLRGTASSIIPDLAIPRGEFTIVLGPLKVAVNAVDLPPDADVALEFGELAKHGGIGRRDAVVAVARKYGRSAREVYAAIERAKGSVK